MSNGDHIRFNATFTNPGITPAPATFSQTFTSALIDKPSQYFLTIERFNAQTCQVPSLVFINNTYSFTITDLNGLPYRTFLTWIPNANDGTMNVYSWYHFLDIANTALLASWTLLLAANPGFYVGMAAPYLVLNTSNEEVILYAPTPGTAYKIYFNNEFEPFFSNFNTFNYTTYGTDLNGEDYSFIFPLFPTYADPATPAGYTKMTQDFPALSELSSARSLRFVTGNMPTRQEQLTGINNQQSILTDFSLDLDNTGGGARNFVQYSTQGPYRLIDMISDAPLNRIDLQIFWVDIFGNSNPLMLTPDATCDCKLLFRNKKLGI